MKMTTNRLVKGAAIAGIYAVITMVLPSYTAFQFKIGRASCRERV